MVAGGLAREKGYDVVALSIDYGQRHRRELDAARAVGEMLGVTRHVVLPLDLTVFGGSALTADIAVPKDGVDEAGIPVTYVPARNTIFLSLTLGLAEVVGARHIYIGVNARVSDHGESCHQSGCRGAWGNHRDAAPAYDEGGYRA
jgi:7-cyano-7-deazaguanine synthase